MKKKSIIVDTPFFPGLIIFLILITLPSLKTLIPLGKNYETIKTAILDAYKNTEIPDIDFIEGEVRSNNDLPFKTKFASKNNQGDFYIGIDTGITPNTETKEWIKSGAGGIAIFRKEALIYAASQNKETIINYDNLPIKTNFSLNADFINNLLTKFKSIFIIALLAFVFLGHFLGKIILWGIVALIYSGKAKIAGGGNYSLALWSLVPPTIFQVFMSFIPAFACCGFIIYYIVWVITFITLEKKLVPIPVEE